MRAKWKLCCLFVLLAGTLSFSFAQSKAKRLTFPHGKNVVTVKGRWVPGSMNDYLVRARAGQTMRVKVVSPLRPAVNDEPNNANTYVETPSGEPLGEMGKVLTVKLPETRDYTVGVISDKGGHEFTLTVSIK